MDHTLIPVLADTVHMSNVKTPEGTHVVLYCGLKRIQITPNEATRQLLVLCDGTHTLEEIVVHFSRISGEDPLVIGKKIEKIVETLVQNGVLTLCETAHTIDIPQAVLIHPLQEVSIEVTDLCNLNCVHCYNNYGIKQKDELTLKEIYTLIDELKRLGVLIIKLSGGEPLMHPDFFEIAHYIHDNSLQLDLFTNGTLITEEIAQKLKKLDFSNVSVSLDSLTPAIHDQFRGKKGAWKKTMEGINHLKKMGIPVTPAVSLSQLNMDDIRSLCRYFVENGFSTYKVQPVFATGRDTPLDIGITPDEFEKAVKDILLLQKEIKKESHTFDGNNCGIGTYSLVIGSNGDVRPCAIFGKKATLGNVREQSVKDIWNNSSLLNTLRTLNARDHPVCSTCDLFIYCRGGCIGNVCMATGAFAVYDLYTCAYMKAAKAVAEAAGVAL
jgi:radical SAM protein with 4Fe4S-binding SPASM domain